MNVEEIERYLASSSSRSICVDRCMSEKYPGFVRDITISNPSDVIVEFNVHGFDEGGLQLRLHYLNLTDLIQEVALFLGKPIEKWANHNRTGWYPNAPDDSIDFDVSGNSLKNDLSRGALELPAGWLSQTIPSDYWRSLINRRI